MTDTETNERGRLKHHQIIGLVIFSLYSCLSVVMISVSFNIWYAWMQNQLNSISDKCSETWW